MTKIGNQTKLNQTPNNIIKIKIKKDKKIAIKKMRTRFDKKKKKIQLD